MLHRRKVRYCLCKMKGRRALNIKVNLKSIGKKKQSVKPVIYTINDNPHTVRELILAVVETGVREYNERMESPDILSYLTKEKIEEKAQTGKVNFGINYGEKKAQISKAKENALQCFEDGIYRIFLNERALEDLEEEIDITEESVFTFVRLTMLAGRMW